MKNLLFFLLFYCTNFFVFAQQPKFNASLKSALLSTDFNWSIAGNVDGKAPNVLSELIWTDLTSVQNQITAGYFLTNKIGINGSFAHGKISKGTVNDADYLEDNRKQSIFNRTFDSDKGYVQSLNLNLVVRKQLNSKLELNGLLGYENFVQKFYLLNNSLDEELNSNYKNNWNGVQLGFDLKYTIKKFVIATNIKSGFYKYYASANWNLRPNLKKPTSFEQKANGYKYGGSLHLAYLLNKNLTVNGGLGFNYGATFAGKDYLYFTDERVSTTKFNGAEFKNKFAQIGIEVFF